MRYCIHPLSDATGAPLFDGKPIIVQEHPEFSWPHGRRLRCGKPVPMERLDRLCDEHLAAVGDKAVSAYIERILT